MAGPDKHYVIAIEEHYLDAEIAARNGSNRQGARLTDRLNDMTGIRLREMDEGGIDLQVLSHAPPAAQAFDAETAVALARAANDRLAVEVGKHPDRFAAFATLPTPDPEAAADELERSVTKLGFKGAMIHGMTGGLFHDDKRFWPIFERAQALDVPIYLHPDNPHPAVVDAYYKDFAEDHPYILRAGLGYTVEMAVATVRLVLSRVFDAYPRLNFILGHMGEGIPFLLWRIDDAFKRPGSKWIAFRDVFCEHFYITTSGNFSSPALLCSLMELGADRIIFSIDWPYVMNPQGTAWIDHMPVSAEDREKILNGNARRLLKL